MPSIDQYALHEIIPELLLFRLNLDIPAFVRAAVRDGLKRDEILGSLHIITNTPDATDNTILTRLFLCIFFRYVIVKR